MEKKGGGLERGAGVWRKKGGGLEKKQGGLEKKQGGLEKKQGGLEKYLRTPAHLCRLSRPSRHDVPRARSLRGVLRVGTRADESAASCAVGGYPGAIRGAGWAGW